MDSGFCPRRGDGAGEPLDGRQPFPLPDSGRFAHCPSSDHDHQALYDLSLRIWRLTSFASLSQGVSLS